MEPVSEHAPHNAMTEPGEIARFTTRAATSCARKRLFEGFDRSFELEQTGVRRSRLATFLDYRVAKG